MNVTRNGSEVLLVEILLVRFSINVGPIQQQNATYTTAVMNSVLHPHINSCDW